MIPSVMTTECVPESFRNARHKTDTGPVDSPRSFSPASAVVTQQSIHVPLLFDVAGASNQANQVLETYILECGRGEKYHNWWLEHQCDSCLFNVRLVGDASTPHKHTSMSHVDLAFACSWGHNRVHEYKGQEPLQLTLPVCTDPGIVQQLIAGLCGGRLYVCWWNVEQLLVLVNFIGVRCELNMISCMLLSPFLQHAVFICSGLH